MKKTGPRPAEVRVKGLLAMLPWLMQRQRVSIAEMARQFDISEADLIQDIEMAAMCGVPPYTPFELTEIYIDEGYINVGLNKYFERRLDLTSAEAFGLSLMAAAAEEIPGFTKRRELKSALKKLRKVLGEDVVDVDVEAPEFLSVVSRAASTGEKLLITYWTPAKNEESARTIVVRTVFAERGHWYVSADDGLSSERRHFRVDRIRSVQPTGELVPVVAETVTVPDWFSRADGNIEAIAIVAPSAMWVVETYPCKVLEELSDGSLRISLVVTSEHWLGRLLLRAGSGVTIEQPSDLIHLQQQTAADVLRLYDNKA